MKTMKCLLLSFAFAMPLFLFAQPKSAFFMKSGKLVQLQMQHPSDLNTDLTNTQFFLVDIAKSICTRSGSTLTAILHSDVRNFRYIYQWKVDGAPFGNGNQLQCVSGSIATVTVTRYPGGARASATISLSRIPTDK